MKAHTVHGWAVLAAADQMLGENSFFARGQRYCLLPPRTLGRRGLSARAQEKIPLSARLMSLADVYDALRSKRVYKAPMPHPTAAAIIQDGSGSQFDPDVVKAFLAIQDKFEAIATRFNDA